MRKVKRTRHFRDGTQETRTDRVETGFTPEGVLQIVGTVLRSTNTLDDIKLAMRLPTILKSEPWRGFLGALIINSDVKYSDRPEHVQWYKPIEVDAELGRDLTLHNFYAHRGGMSRVERGQTPPHTSLLIPTLGKVHSRFVERREKIAVGPGVTVDTRRQAIEAAGVVDSRPPATALGVLTMLAEAEGGYVSPDELAAGCGIVPRGIMTYVVHARNYIEERMPPGYAIQAEQRVGYRLRVPGED